MNYRFLFYQLPSSREIPYRLGSELYYHDLDHRCRLHYHEVTNDVQEVMHLNARPSWLAALAEDMIHVKASSLAVSMAAFRVVQQPTSTVAPAGATQQVVK